MQRAEQERHKNEVARRIQTLQQDFAREQQRAVQEFQLREKIERDSKHELQRVQSAIAQRETELKREQVEKEKIARDAQAEYERLSRAIHAKDQVAEFEREMRIRLERTAAEARASDVDKPAQGEHCGWRWRPDRERKGSWRFQLQKMPLRKGVSQQTMATVSELTESAKTLNESTPAEMARKEAPIRPSKPSKQPPNNQAPSRTSAKQTPSEVKPKSKAGTGKKRPGTSPIAKLEAKPRFDQQGVGKTATVTEWRPKADRTKADRPGGSSVKRGRRGTSWMLIGGWAYLVAGAVLIAMSPAVYWVYGAFLFALVLGSLVLKSRRSPLVWGLIWLSILLPVAGFVGAKLSGFGGLMPNIGNNMVAAFGLDTVIEGGEGPGGNYGGDDVMMVGVGHSTTSCHVRVTFEDVRLGRITITDVVGHETTSDSDYLIVELNLENVSTDRIVVMNSPWRETELVNNEGSHALVVYEQRGAGYDRIEGTIEAAELKPGESIRDWMVFERPSTLSGDYVIVSKPHFMSSDLNGEQVSKPKQAMRLSFDASDVDENSWPKVLAEGT